MRSRLTGLPQGSRPLATPKNPDGPLDIGAVADLEGEDMLTCGECGLPIGDMNCYVGDSDERHFLHGECKVQALLKAARKEESSRRRKDARLKFETHKEYDIGWNVDRIPRNIELASTLNCDLKTPGMCCLVLDMSKEDSYSVRLAPTMDPEASVNLEYLSLALKVRELTGKEPLFSLDPAGPDERRLVKHFEPEWLAGTSAGELLFQADVYLKELSMGEHPQPVVGMRSCLDYIEDEVVETEDKAWSAREWFVMNDAEIRISRENALIPHVKMGVNAREMVKSSDGSLEDSPITREDHPLVRYAEEFTQNFDLIAERKSVIYHLREFAKAVALAKFLLDPKVALEDDWYSLAGKPKPQSEMIMEIPQLWNVRVYSQLDALTPETKSIRAKMHGLYGGVELSLDEIRLQNIRKMNLHPHGPVMQSVQAILARNFPDIYQIWTNMDLGAEPVAPGIRGARAAFYRAQAALRTQAVLRTIGAPPTERPLPGGVQELSRERTLAIPLSAFRIQEPFRLKVPEGVELPLKGLKGVDLSLKKFDLSTSTVKLETRRGDIGCKFWNSMSEDRDGHSNASVLLRMLFNAHLADRPDEGDFFVPPDTREAYLEKLSFLLAEEQEWRQARIDHFLSVDFKMEDAGPLFPSSWKSTGVLDRPNGAPVQEAFVYERPDCMKKDMKQVLSSASVAFEKCTEDGMTFRIYQLSSLELRTTQEHDDDEVIGAIYSNSPALAMEDSSVDGRENVVKITQYIKKVGDAALAPVSLASTQISSYVVLETADGNVIVTEKQSDHKVEWTQNPANLETRNSTSRVFRVAECTSAGITVQDMKNYHSQEESLSKGRSTAFRATLGECLSYAQGIYDRVGPILEQQAKAKIMSGQKADSGDETETCDASESESQISAGTPWVANPWDPPCDPSAEE